MRPVVAIVTSCAAALIAATADAEEHNDAHGGHRHHAALFGGVGVERGRNDHTHTGTALGLEYHYRLTPRWSIGFDAERIFGSDSSNRDWAFAVPLTYHLSEHWKVFAGPGLEDSEFGSDAFMVRVGLAWEDELSENWTWSPEIVVDILENGDTVYIAGVAIGFGF